MEKFKLYEKQAKTKAFSKEGLRRQREKDLKGDDSMMELANWLRSQADELREQAERLEEEIEELDSDPKRKKASGDKVAIMREKMEKMNDFATNTDKLATLVERGKVNKEEVSCLTKQLD